MNVHQLGPSVARTVVTIGASLLCLDHLMSRAAHRSFNIRSRYGASAAHLAGRSRLQSSTQAAIMARRRWLCRGPEDTMRSATNLAAFARDYPAKPVRIIEPF